MTVYELSNKISNGEYDSVFSKKYGMSEREILRQRARYLSLAENFSRFFPLQENMSVFSVSDIIKICGDFTEKHNRNVLSAALNRDILVFAAKNEDNIINIISEGKKICSVNTDEIISEKTGETERAVLETLQKISEKKAESGGFDACISCDLPDGNNLKRGDFYKIIVKKIMLEFYNKPDDSGAILSSMEVLQLEGGFLLENHSKNDSLYNKVSCDICDSGYSVCFTDLCSEKNDFQAENENALNHISEIMDIENLSEADESDFYSSVNVLNEKCSAAEIMSAAYFYEESRCAEEEAESLKAGNLQDFFRIVNSLEMSFENLRNMYLHEKGGKEALAVLISRNYLNGSGAVRIMAESGKNRIMAFVPNYMVNGYISCIEAVFGKESCHIEGIKPYNMNF